MTRLPHGIPEEVLMQFVTAVVLVTVTVAFVAYVGTWISARRRRAPAEAAGPDRSGEPIVGLAAGRPESNGRARRTPSHVP